MTRSRRKVFNADYGRDKRKNWMHKAKDPTQRLGLYKNAAEMPLRTAGTLVVILHISSRMSHLPAIQATLIEYWNLSQCQPGNASFWFRLYPVSAGWLTRLAWAGILLNIISHYRSE
jgi:hypothetical protein